jgi:hypothetical protein
MQNNYHCDRNRIVGIFTIAVIRRQGWGEDKFGLTFLLAPKDIEAFAGGDSLTTPCFSYRPRSCRDMCALLHNSMRRYPALFDLALFGLFLGGFRILVLSGGCKCG